MNLEEQFNLIAREYDINRQKFIPCFNDFYISATDFISCHIDNPKRILDLGAGTGLLSAFYYKYFPDAEYVLADIAEDMLEIAKKRFSGLSNVSYKIMDFSKDLPDGKFDIIISALAIHHLEDAQKSELFKRINEKLSDGGLFVNYDQFCAGSNEMNVWFDTYWENQLNESDLTEKDLELWRSRRKLDRECSVEDETAMLEKCKFKSVKCVYQNQKFAVIVSIK